MTQENVFYTAVARVAATLLDLPYVATLRYEPDESATIIAESNDRGLVDLNLQLDGPSVVATVRRTGKPARLLDYGGLAGNVATRVRGEGFDEVFGVPIIVGESIWGAFVAVIYGGRHLPEGLEERIGTFAEVVATAIASAQVRDEMQALADEQAALRRIATIVATGAEPAVVFDAVCARAGELIGATSVNLAQFTADGSFAAVGGWSSRGAFVPVGTRYSYDEDTISAVVWRTSAPARRDTYDDATSELATFARDQGLASSVAVPILAEERLWGTLVAASEHDNPLPSSTEERLSRFADLVALAVLNAMARSELIASRARIVAAGDEARRRIERNLHDGVQQRLIALGLDLQTVTARLPVSMTDFAADLDGIGNRLEAVLDDVRELSRGLHPVLLARRGLGPSLRALARGAPIPVRLSVEMTKRAPQPVEIAIYYVVSELLTNVTRHAEASEMAIEVSGNDETINATITDDGVGGADPSAGTGLTGLTDRVEALGGRLVLVSPPHKGTTVFVEIPNAVESRASSWNE